MQPKAQSRLEAFRGHRDHFFAHDPDSPLAPDDREDFAGLAYFPERKDLALELALDESGPDVGEVVELATSDGQQRQFVRAGRVTFEADGEPVTLTVFREQGRGRYFLPFKDATSGSETYEGGRYLDPRARPDGRLVVDLNSAYNPYCAYSDGWSCPAPPFENIVRARIEAGEKAFVRKASRQSVG
jgi:uncharacterized protein (DUF1684 family)